MNEDGFPLRLRGRRFRRGAGEMTSEPTGGQRAHTFECPRLLEQVRGSGHDLQLIRTPEQRPGSPIQLPDDRSSPPTINSVGERTWARR